MTVKTISSRKCISKSTVRAHCRKGYYQGAYKKSGRWIIPESTQNLSCANWQQLSFFPLLSCN
ncbi:MAG: hypothetical protein IJD82_00870 [Clostridia bacterium]|nr:hypothetical protein [Clostridia bacterium]